MFIQCPSQIIIWLSDYIRNGWTARSLLGLLAGQCDSWQLLLTCIGYTVRQANSYMVIIDEIRGVYKNQEIWTHFLLSMLCREALSISTAFLLRMFFIGALIPDSRLDAALECLEKTLLNGESTWSLPVDAMLPLLPLSPAHRKECEIRKASEGVPQLCSNVTS